MLVACSQGAEPGTRRDSPVAPDRSTVGATPPSPERSMEGVIACEDTDATLRDPSLQEGPLSGDVDGDRRSDRTYLVVDPGGAIGCRAFLVVENTSESHTLAIDREELSFDLGLPTLVDLRQIDGRPGLDVVVDLLSGASTVFAGVFTMQSGALKQLQVEGGNLVVPDLFGHGSSTGHIEAADCSDRGVVISAATPAGRLYVVQRRFYRTDGGILRLDPGRDERAAIMLGALPTRFPEFASSLFSNCPRK